MPRQKNFNLDVRTKLPKNGFNYNGIEPLWKTRLPDGIMVGRAMKKGDQGGWLQPAIVDKCIEEMFVAATKHATLTHELNGRPNKWQRVLEELGWNSVLPSLVVRELATYMVTARLRAKASADAGSAETEQTQLRLTAPAIDAYVKRMKDLQLEHLLPEIQQEAVPNDENSEKDDKKKDDEEKKDGEEKKDDDPQSADAATNASSSVAAVSVPAPAQAHPAARLVHRVEKLSLKRKNEESGSESDSEERPATKRQFRSLPIRKK